MTRFKASAVLLQSHPQVSFHSAVARTSQSVPFTSALTTAGLSPGGQYSEQFRSRCQFSQVYLQVKIFCNLHPQQVHLYTYYFGKVFNTILWHTILHQCDSCCLPSTAPKYFIFEKEPERCLWSHGECSEHNHLKALMGSRTATLLRPGVPKWMLQLYSQLCSSSPWDPSKSQNGSQTL